MEELDIVERLRGKVRVPVNDGAGLLDGKDFFERSFPTSKAAMGAADEIERLRADNISMSDGMVALCKLHDADIAGLRAEVADLTRANGLLHAIISNREEEISGLRAQLASAREALEPFAAVAEHDIGDSETNADIFRPMRVHNRARQLTVGDLRAAALALTSAIREVSK